MGVGNADSSEEESKELEDELEVDRVLVKLGRRRGSKVGLECMRAVGLMLETNNWWKKREKLTSRIIIPGSEEINALHGTVHVIESLSNEHCARQNVWLRVVVGGRMCSDVRAQASSVEDS